MSEKNIAGRNLLAGSPDREIHIDENLVRALLRDQCPDVADLPLEFIEEGFDNVTYRLGDDKAVRIPRRAIANRFIANEQQWLPVLAPDLPLPVPVPLHVGAPGADYPWTWSIVPWFEGKPADLAEPATSAALQLVEFMKALHRPAPPGAPFNEFRALPLMSREPFLAPRLERLRAKTNLMTNDLDTLWNVAVAAPVDIEPTWIHGDLHARNVLTQDGLICAIIDWGDMTSGDRATDLASIWMLFGNPDARKTAIDAVGTLTEATWARARGWALYFGYVLLDSGLVDNPRHAAMGERTLRRLAEDL